MAHKAVAGPNCAGGGRPVSVRNMQADSAQMRLARGQGGLAVEPGCGCDQGRRSGVGPVWSGGVVRRLYVVPVAEVQDYLLAARTTIRPIAMIGRGQSIPHRNHEDQPRLPSMNSAPTTSRTMPMASCRRR